MATRNEIKAANRRMTQRREKAPYAVSARYDKRRDKITVELNTGLEVAFAPKAVEGLERAAARDLATIEISPAGLGLHFPRLDADLYLPDLLEGMMGSRHWMAKRLGQAGGQARSPAKAAASRANGTLGGRPRKRA